MARPKPAEHNGGINAVAIATPGIAVVVSFLDAETIPATPPKNAIPISNEVGFVRDNISEVSSPNGDIKKYKKLAPRLTKVAIIKFRIEWRNMSLSCMPTESPKPRIGDISGEINIAPMITAVELVSNPIDANNAEQISSQTL